MDARPFLRAKRDRARHSPGEIRDFVAACLRREIPDYQLSAWLMAAFLNGLDRDETDALTGALIDSGRRFDWHDLGRPTADKHSTGGVGDKVSLVLAPLAACCGVAVPMVAGRGLGHTGGTIDKLESIPGFKARLSPEAMRDQLRRLGAAIVGQGPDLAPADGMIYAMRDVTSTVEFEPFIVSSIVSKKVAEGAQSLVYDVKCGNGAFMRTREAARSLASRLVETTRAMECDSSALITDMNQPLGAAIGNALEVAEAAELLRGRGPADVRALTLELGVRMLKHAGIDSDPASARDRLARVLDAGEAWERFLAIVEAQGGDPRSVEHLGTLAAAPLVRAVGAPREGRVVHVDTYGLGEVAVSIGAGRRAKDHAIDPRVGIVVRVRLGDPVGAGSPLAELHLAEERPDAAARLAACFEIGPGPVEPARLVLESID